jgi:PAS domain S-box-containing protein
MQPPFSQFGGHRAQTIFILSIPALLAAVLLWSGQIWTVPGYVSLVFVAAIARVWGLRAALVAVVAEGTLLWFVFFPLLLPGRAQMFYNTRLALFVTVSTIIVFIILQKDEAEERYRKLVDLAPDAIGIFDEDGRILFANPSMIRMVGAATDDQVVGHHITEFVPPEQRENARERIATLVRGDRVGWKEVPWRRLDGKTITVEVAGVPVRHGGKLVGQGFARDITERKEAEAAAEENRRRFEALFNATLDAILFVDSEGCYVGANAQAARLLGYTRDELLSMKRGDISTRDGQDQLAGLWARASAGKRARGECIIRRRDGTTLEVELQIVTDVVPGIQALSLYDISSRKAAERSVHHLSARLLHLQDEERRRIARELHDTTAQNLTAIRLLLTRVVRRDGFDDALREPLDEALALTDTSINEVRTLSYLLHPPMIEEAGLMPALRWYAQGFEERSGVRSTLDLPDELDRLPAELETALFRIVQESLTNIQRHSGSRVATIRLEMCGNALCLTIADEGHGMPPHLRGAPAILGATGVGIAGMRERARELGGTLSIESGETGTTVRVTLPLSGVAA